MAQLWLFWLAPMVGAALAGAVGNALFKDPDQSTAKALSAVPERTPVP